MYAFGKNETISGAWRRKLRILCIILAVAVLGGCDVRPPTSDPGLSPGQALRPYIDDLGRTVEIPTRPTRVVSLAPSLTEFLAGAADLLVAITTADDYPPAVNEITQIGAFPLNNEAVVAQSPDLILATNQVNSPHDIEPISELGIPAVFFTFESVDDIILAVHKVGDLLAVESTAQAAADELAARWARLQSASTTPGSRPKLLLLIGYDILYAFGGESYTNEMITRAGAESVTSGLPGQSAVLSDEFVLGSEPDIIVVAGEPNFDPDDMLEYHPTWDVLPAVRDKRVYSIDPDLVFRPGPRVIDGTERMAEIVAGISEAPRQ